MLRLLTASALLGALAFSCSDEPASPDALGPVVRFKFAPEFEIRLAPLRSLADADEWLDLFEWDASQDSREHATAKLALIRAPDDVTLDSVVRALESVYPYPISEAPHYVLGIMLDSIASEWEIPQRVEPGLTVQPLHGTYRIWRDGFPRVFVRMNPATRDLEVRWEAAGRVGNGHYGTHLVVLESWFESAGWISLSDGLLLWNLGEGGLGEDVPVWFEESTTIQEARAAWSEFSKAGVRLLALQTFSVSEDPPAADSDE